MTFELKLALLGLVDDTLNLHEFMEVSQTQFQELSQDEEPDKSEISLQS